MDTDEFLANPGSMEIVDFNRVCAIEPVLIGIWDLPVGMDLQLVDDGSMNIGETETGREIPPDMWFVPPDRREPSASERGLMMIEGAEPFLGEPTFIAATEETLKEARGYAARAGQCSGTVFSALVGGTSSADVIINGGNAGPRGDLAAEPLESWFHEHPDPELGSVWWWALTFDASSASLEWSRDEFPPARIRALIEANGLDLDLAHNWVLQRKAFDHRPADRLPEWWVEKLESVGAWDPVKKELAVDEDANPLHGPQLFGEGPDDEFYPNDGDDDVQP